MNKPVTETELVARNVGQRVTLEDVNAAIIAEHYFTAADGVFGARIVGSHPGPAISDQSRTLPLLTFCVLTLWNGFTVTGQSACADPSNYKQDIGERIARQDAVNKIWPLLGYSLRSQITLALLQAALNEPDSTEAAGPEAGAAGATGTAGEGQNPVFAGLAEETVYQGVGVLELPKAPATPTTWLDRLMKERHDLANRLQALDGFIEGRTTTEFYHLPKAEQSDQKEQASFMRGLLVILDRRIQRALGHRGV